MNICTTHLRRSHDFVDGSPVQPSRASQYTLDKRPSLDTSEHSGSASHTVLIDQTPPSQQHRHVLRRKKAYDALTQAAPQASQPGGMHHRRTSSLDKFLKKVQGMLKHKSSAASFASVLVKATSHDSSSLPATLHHKKDLLDLRFEFEQGDAAQTEDHINAERAMSEDRESAWVTDYESEAEGDNASR